MEIQLSDSFDYKKLIRFTLPSIVMMVFTSIYTVVDGFFVSNFVGSTAFAAINLIIPYFYIFGAIGFMIGAGGSALVALTLGCKEEKRAHQIFSLLIYVLIAMGIVCSIFGFASIRKVSLFLGADASMLPYSVTYGRLLMVGLVPFMLQNVFQSFLIAAQKPKYGLYVTVLAGISNMILDALFIAYFEWGVAGAALATAFSQCIGGLIPLFYFSRPNSSLLRLGKTVWDGRSLLKTCANGSSEFMTNISMSLISMLYNFQLLEIAGEDGVAAYGVIMYVGFIFIAVFLGYSIGSAPLISYHYGAQNKKELHNLFVKSLTILICISLGLTLLSEGASSFLAHVFVGYDTQLKAMTQHGFSLYSLSFLIAGFNIFGSAFFTALNNGLISALISFGRTLVFQALCIWILPLLLGLDGVWLAVVAAETMALILTTFCLKRYKKEYGY